MNETNIDNLVNNIIESYERDGGINKAGAENSCSV